MSVLALAHISNDSDAGLRRWGVSIGFALLVHGVAVAALLTWHREIIPITLRTQVVVDLLPLPGKPEAGQIKSADLPAPVLDRTEAAAATTKQTATASAAPAVAFSASSDVEERNGEEARAGGGSASHAAPRSGHAGGASDAGAPASGAFDNSPIDTSITVQPSLYGKKAGAGMTRKKNFVLLRPSKHAGTLQRPSVLGTSRGTATLTNALGAHVQDRARAALAREASRAVPKNAIGGTPTLGIVGGGGTNTAEGYAKNAIGMTVRVAPSFPASGPQTNPIGQSKAAPTAFAGPALNRSAINGREIVRPGLGTGVIGGPARNVAGGISGSNFVARHP